MSAPTRVVVFRLGEQQYGVELPAVERVVAAMEITPLPHAPAAVAGVIDLGGRIIPVFDLRRRLAQAARSIGRRDQFLVARAGTRTIALAVDEALGVLDLAGRESIAPSAVVAAVDGVSALVRHAEGILLIHDLEHFLSAEDELALNAALELRQPHAV